MMMMGQSDVLLLLAPASSLTPGFSGHMMAIAPSNATFRELMLRAERGEFLPYRNNHEDLLERVFPPRFAAVPGMNKKTGARNQFDTVVPHVHLQGAACKMRQNKGWGWLPRTCGEVIRLCNLSKTWARLQWEQLLN